MATKNYQWTAALNVDSGGYEGELIAIKKDGVTLYEGAVGPHTKSINLPWTTTTDDVGEQTYTYSYRDSDHEDNNNCTEVEVTIKDTWRVTIDNSNVMTVKVTTELVSAVRKKHGSITNANRRIWLRRSSSGSDFAPFPLIDNASTAHTIASNVNLGEYTFTLQPGDNAERSTVWWRSTMVGHEGDHLPNKYTDILGIGIRFKNILPKDYRPGKVKTNTSTWYSCNRSGGKCHIIQSGGTLKELRTTSGGTSTGNPPYIKHPSGWINQRKIGTE